MKLKPPQTPRRSIPRPVVLVVAAIAGLITIACDKTAEAPPPAASKVAQTEPVAAHAPADSGIAWKQAASDSEIDDAFAAARAANKPVFVYWGAKWCPPCNQVKATLFNRQDFIERSRGFVPNAPDDVTHLSGICTVGVEGDSKEAVRALLKAGVVTTSRGGGVRISTHVFNDEEDLDKLFHAID